MKSDLAVALDVSSAKLIQPILNTLPAEVQWCKIGLELFVADGPAAIELVASTGRSVFLDLKFHDIPRTVARAVTSASRHGTRLLTVHASGGRDMLRAAAAAARELAEPRPKLVAVTALTSLDQDDLNDLGVQRPLKAHALALAELALACGIDGLVCSVHEAGEFRDRFGASPIIVTPGIRLRAEDGASPGQVRPAGAKAEDQKRVATPAAAVRAGANILVVGRPILDAPDPAAAVCDILNQMRSAR